MLFAAIKVRFAILGDKVLVAIFTGTSQRAPSDGGRVPQNRDACRKDSRFLKEPEKLAIGVTQILRPFCVELNSWQDRERKLACLQWLIRIEMRTAAGAGR